MRVGDGSVPRPEHVRRGSACRTGRVLDCSQPRRSHGRKRGASRPGAAPRRPAALRELACRRSREDLAAARSRWARGSPGDIELEPLELATVEAGDDAVAEPAVWALSCDRPGLADLEHEVILEIEIDDCFQCGGERVALTPHVSASRVARASLPTRAIIASPPLSAHVPGGATSTRRASSRWYAASFRSRSSGTPSSTAYRLSRASSAARRLRASLYRPTGVTLTPAPSPAPSGPPHVRGDADVVAIEW